MIKKITLLAISIYLLTGCEVRGRPEVVPIEGYLTTPEGKAKFKKLSSPSFIKVLGITNDSDKIRFLQATTESTGIAFSPTKRYSSRTLMISSRNKESDFLVKLKPDEAFYQIDDTEKKKWPLPKSYTRIIKSSPGSGKEWRGAYYGLENELDIKSYHELKKIRYYLPFTIDDKLYLMDVTLKFTTDYYIHWEIGFPGSP